MEWMVVIGIIVLLGLLVAFGFSLLMLLLMSLPLLLVLFLLGLPLYLVWIYGWLGGLSAVLSWPLAFRLWPLAINCLLLGVPEPYVGQDEMDKTRSK